MIFESDSSDEQTRGTVFKEVARLKDLDARILLKYGRAIGSVYLAGYSIECHLKYTVCEKYDFVYLPTRVQFESGDRWHKLYSHQWDTLVEAADLRGNIKRSREIDKIYSSLSASWGPDLRYRTKDFPKREGELIMWELLESYNF